VLQHVAMLTHPGTGPKKSPLGIPNLTVCIINHVNISPKMNN